LYAGAYLGQNQLENRIERRALTLANEYASAYSEDGYHEFDINFAWKDIENIIHGKK
tara:strand:+ start:178 stop:348 length:171 start_codon:yes stop_codon:yes gene_type:complete